MKIDSFYESLPLVTEFVEVANPTNYRPVPESWHVIITDVRGSTKAIDAGRYKEVNMVGASSIAAMLHAAGDVEVPFIFGGDGATFVVPPELLIPAEKALLGAQNKARELFDMDLRVGIVGVKDVYAAGQRILVSRFEISKHYHQAMFMGGGLTYAEKLIKDPELGAAYSLTTTHEPDADFHGLSCRWRDVESRHGETISLLVKANRPDDSENDRVYREVIARIEEVYGAAEDHHPISTEKLMISLASRVAEQESRLIASHKPAWYRFFMRLKLRVFLVGAYLIDHLRIPLPMIDFQRYKHTLVRTTDYKKFDDVLRMVISGTTAQRETLTEFLEEKYLAGELLYGIHVSDRALMTCLVFEREGRQVHFVDAADGGYTMAAKQLKAQIAKAS